MNLGTCHISFVMYSQRITKQTVYSYKSCMFTDNLLRLFPLTFILYTNSNINSPLHDLLRVGKTKSYPR